MFIEYFDTRGRVLVVGKEVASNGLVTGTKVTDVRNDRNLEERAMWTLKRSASSTIKNGSEHSFSLIKLRYLSKNSGSLNKNQAWKNATVCGTDEGRLVHFSLFSSLQLRRALSPLQQ